MAKKHIEPLKYTKQARHRITVGLNWDPRAKGPSLSERLSNIGQNTRTYDLDLACVIYDREKRPADGVSSRPDETADRSGKIYHTGDDSTGRGDLDDEQISVELRDLPEYIDQIVFVAEIQSAHTFDTIKDPYIRLSDGMSNVDQVKLRLDRPEGIGKTAYVFARIYQDIEGTWMVHIIDEFADSSAVEDWIPYLKKYLS